MKESELREWLNNIEDKLKKIEKSAGSNKEHATAETIVDMCKKCPECCKAHKKAYEQLEEEDIFDDLDEEDEGGIW